MENLKIEYLKKIQSLVDYINMEQNMRNYVKQQDRDEDIILEQKLFLNPIKRIYNYNLIVITLYGIFESFIEQTVCTYLRNLEKYVPNYNDLPITIVERHMMLSAELIQNADKLSKYKNIKKEEIITNLNSCITNQDNYKINVEAFSHHTANFRKDNIRTIFQNIGFQNIISGMVKNINVTKYFIEIEKQEEADLKLKQEEGYFEILLDLVERRNQIAHGTESDDLLSIERLKDYVFYIEALMNAILDIVMGKLLKIRIKYARKKSLGMPLKVFPKLNVIGIQSNNVKICKNMQIYALSNSNDKAYIGKIDSIQHDKKYIEEVSEIDNWEIGIKVESFSVNEKYEYGILYN